MRHLRLFIRVAATAAILALLPWSGDVITAQSKKKPPPDTSRSTTITDTAGRTHTRYRPFTQAERKAAGDRLRAKRVAAAEQAKMAAAAAIGTPQEATLAAAAEAAAALAMGPLPLSALRIAPNGELVPDYSGVTPNYANSPAPVQVTDSLTGAPVFDPITGAPVLTGGLQKFVDTLPGLTAAGMNNLNQYLPVAIAEDWCARAGAPTPCEPADYYEIELGEYEMQMHSDLPPTRLRGYRQVNTSDATVSQFQYLGPVIVAARGKPVRIKFINNLPTGAPGNLFVPVDKTIMGSGAGPNMGTGVPGDVACRKDALGAVPPGCYSENRADLHLHGGVTPWISDGTPHQWITPAGEVTDYPKGVSVYNVPDMEFPGKPPAAPLPDPAAGTQTYYYTNDQSARLMFYHDHAYGTTRLNVYVGEAAGYLLTDAVEKELVDAGVIPADQIPLIIQDKAFVDATTIRQQDPTWSSGTGATFTTHTDPATGATMQLRDPKTGDLWWPHVYMPAQNPYDLTGANAMGRWHYGPWFWPPTTIPFGPVPNPYYDCNALGLADATHPCTMPWQPPEVPSAPNPSWGAEAFLDTPVVNGTAYPTLTVAPKAYRFRILNAAHDRFWNLQLYVAASKSSPTVEGTTGAVMCDGTTTIPAADCTEVKMVPAAPNTGLPAKWPVDGRVGGVPDPTTTGPSFYYIGTEGGFLPMPVEVPNQPITWNANPTTFNFGNVVDHAVLLGPAERADVIVDFSAYAGKTLILYNDAPAAFPALDPRNDYYTGDPDLRDSGGAPSTFAGYGPNIRTIMQIRVEGTPAPAFDFNALTTAWAPQTVPDPTDPTQTFQLPGVFQRGQDEVIVGQTAYNEAYGKTFPAQYPAWGVARIQDTQMVIESVNGTRVLMNLDPKAIHDEMGATFDDYGRMSAKLGLELPKSTAMVQNFVMQGYTDPATELVRLSDTAVPIGNPDRDGTQIWKITHNGVDTHPIHFHLFHVQLINRVGWDGAIRLPHPTELGWKDTLRISPLEDTIVALRPIAPRPETLPWELPNSVRPLNPALPIGSTVGFTHLDPLGNAITVSNQEVNLGWEYVWHCHILSHEENDMMRSVIFAVPPRVPPVNLTAIVSGNNNNRRVNLTWTDTSINTTAFVLQKSPDPTFATGVTTVNLPATPQSYSDPIGRVVTPLFYRVAASNRVGGEVTGFPSIAANSDWSNTADVNPVTAPSLLSATLLAGPQVRLVFTDNAVNETSFVVERSTGGIGFVQIGTLGPRNNTGTAVFTDVAPVTGINVYQVKAVSGLVSSGYSNQASVVLPAAPLPPSAFTASAVLGNGQKAIVTLAWADNSTDEAGFVIERALDAGFATGLATINVAANTTTVDDTVANGGTAYYYRIKATNLGGGSTPVSAVPFPVVTP